MNTNINKTQSNQNQYSTVVSKHGVIIDNGHSSNPMKNYFENYVDLVKDTGLFQRIIDSVKEFNQNSFQSNVSTWVIELEGEKEKFFETDVYLFKDKEEIEAYIKELFNKEKEVRKCYVIYCTFDDEKSSIVWRYKINVNNVINFEALFGNKEQDITYEYSVINVTQLLKK